MKTDMIYQGRFVDYALGGAAVVCGIGSVLLLVLLGLSGLMHFGWSERDILLWDAFLSLVFFVQHSSMVRRPFRERLGAIVSPRYHGAIYSIASGIALTAVVLFWQTSDTMLLVLDGVPLLIARACSLSAVLIFVLSIQALGSFDMVGIRPIRDHFRQRNPQPSPFVVRGPYRWVRHPLYFCVLILFWSTPELRTDQLLFNLLWTAWIYVGTMLEERDLRNEFGDAYVQYQKAVPMLVPWRGPVAKSALGP